MHRTGRTGSALFPIILLFLLLTFAALLPRTNPARHRSVAAPAAIDIAELERLFENPPDDSKIMMRWWWFGPAVTKPELEREMRLMKEGGIGGFEVQPVYPMALDDAASGIKNLPFLSDEFIDALHFTSEKARDLGLRIDVTMGSGWPYGGPQVPISRAAGRLRVERIKAGNQRRVALPYLTAGEKLLAVFIARSEGKTIAADSLEEVTAEKDGAVWLPAGMENDREVIFFIAGRTGMMVKRASVGADGFVLDHYDRAAIDDYLRSTGDRLMQAFAGRPPRAVFCDSLEVFQSDWTGDFLEEFKKRRGYDLKPYLPALIAEVGPRTAAIRHDWGQTLTELLNDQFLAPVRDWAKRHQTLFRIQGYGIPPATIASNAYADLPEGEGVQWKSLSAARWASSASHLYGRQITSSETWTWLHSPSFRATPLDAKAEADLHFLQGINQLIGHGWPYNPERVEYPGWRFYAAAVFNQNNPWWIVMPDLSRYLQRVSFIMRQGRPANDVAVYLPNHDAWAGFTSGRVHYMIEALRERIGEDVVAQTIEAGFNPDFFDDETLSKIGRLEKETLVLGENRYKAVILPNVERIPPETLQRFEEFARAGGVVIATRRTPAIAPGFKAQPDEHEQIRQTARRMFEGPNPLAHFVASEKGQLGTRLASLLRPDVAITPASPEIGFIHRSAGEAEIYFLANTSNRRQVARAVFRRHGRPELRPEWWNPMTGSVTPADVLSEGEDGTTVPLEIEPYGSRLLVFTNRSLARRIAQAPAIIPSPVDLSAGWRVSFGQSGQPVTVGALRSWTDDEETRFFSGLASYEKDLVVDDELLQPGLKITLDLGQGNPLPIEPRRNGMRAWFDAPVREAAVIYVNDRRAGSAWCPPYQVDLTGLLKRGENRIRIVVGNTAINHLAGRRLPDYRLLNLRYGVRFEPQDMNNLQPLASGLLGPIRLVSKAASAGD